MTINDSNEVFDPPTFSKYQVTIEIVRDVPDGTVSTSIPTLYLDRDLQGIVSHRHAALIASTVVRLAIGETMYASVWHRGEYESVTITRSVKGTFVS